MSGTTTGTTSKVKEGLAFPFICRTRKKCNTTYNVGSFAKWQEVNDVAKITTA